MSTPSFRDANFQPVAYDGKQAVTWRVSCYGLHVIEGKLLVVKQQNEHYWDIPGGGVEPLESLAAGLARESREEAGWHFELGPIIFTADDYFYHSVERTFYHSIQLYSHVTQACHLGTPTDARTERVELVSPAEFTQLPLYPNILKAFHHLSQRKLI